MVILPKQITSEFFKYKSSLSVDRFKTEINILSNQKNDRVNLKGNFINEFEFQIANELEIGPFPFSSTFYRSTTIEGYIYKHDNDTTQINILISPHSFIQLLFLILPIFYTVMFFTVETSLKDLKFYILLIILYTMTPIILLLLSGFVKKNLLAKFVKYFNLTQIV